MSLFFNKTIALKKCIKNYHKFVKIKCSRRTKHQTFRTSTAAMASESENRTLDIKEWHPTILIAGNDKSYACMVLNREFRVPTSIVIQLWENAYIRCTVDGGTNRWRHFLQTQCQDLNLKSPDLITGDFDSITKETIAFFQNPASKHVLTPDQNETDFTKALRLLQPLLAEKQFTNVIVLHDNSGRLDQIMANLNTLSKMQSDKFNIFLLSGNSMTWLLRAGKHKIRIPCELVNEQRWCALIPIGEKAKNVTTSGLKWNLKNNSLEFGELVSTSNTYESEYVEIETDADLIWSMGYFSFTDD